MNTMTSMRMLLGLVVFVLAVSVNVFAVKDYRLRANINPGCATTSSLKYADIYADGNIAVMGSFNCRGVFIFDISNPDAPVLANWYNPGANLQFLEAIVIGNRGYFGTGNTGGVHIVDLTNPSNPALLGIVNASNGGGYPTIHEIMVFDQGGERYLLENSNSTVNRALRIINVTNPTSAVLKWQFNSSDSGWVHAMHIRGDRMYLSGFTGSTRVDIYDISDLAIQAPTLLGSVAVGFGANHSTWTSEDGNYLYSARETTSNSNPSTAGDIRVYDVSNPASPMLVNRFTMDDLAINAVTPHNPVVMGDKLYVAWYQAGTQVFDVSVPASPVRVGQYDTYPQEYVPTENAVDFGDEPWDMICGRSTISDNLLPTNYAGNWAVFPFLGEDKVLLGDLATGLYIIDLTEPNFISDFDGDRRTDLSVWTPATGTWTVERSSNGTSSTLEWGLPGDIPVAGDYDGDGKTDHAIFRPSTGYWWFVMSSNGSRPAIQFGLEGDIPVVGDYDGDGRADLAVFRPSTGVWYISKSSGGLFIGQFGLLGDKPLSIDHDGDGITDIAVWRPSDGVWYILKSSGGFFIMQFGLEGDIPVRSDFDGDGRSEFTIYRPSDGIWYVFDPAAWNLYGFQFGIAEDIPIPADFDGDGKTDPAVFRPSTNQWYRWHSSNGITTVRVFGTAGDVPSPASVQAK